MPTPGGKLKAGDRLRWRNTSGVVEVEAVVAERLGNDDVYSVVLERVDGEDWPARQNRSYGNPKQLLLLEAHYWVFMSSGGWELVPK